MYFGHYGVFLRFITAFSDINHASVETNQIVLPANASNSMFLSKSFGYALRGVLYVALVDREARKAQLDEIAGKLSVPRHFLAKVMKTMVKEGILNSTKGPYGGFSVNNKTFQTKLLHLVKITDGVEQFKTCVLSLRKCNSRNPCPLHYQVQKLRDGMLEEFSRTSIGDLLNEGNPDFIKSIAVI
jgi:Rrf2 family protein